MFFMSKISSKLRAELADGQANGAGQFLREPRPPLEIGGENRIVTPEISRPRVRIDVVELRLLRGVGPDELRPDRLVPGRVMSLTLLDGTQNMVQGRARRLVRRPGRAFSCGKRSCKMFLFLGGKRATESGDGNMAQGLVTAFLGQLRVGERLDTGLELAQEKIDGKIEAGLARLDEKLALNFKPDLAIATCFHDQVGLRGRAVAEHALVALASTRRRWAFDLRSRRRVSSR